MSEKRLVLYYTDPVFLKRFSDYLERKTGLEIRCVTFTEEAPFLDWIRKGQASLVIGKEGFDIRPAEERGIPFLVFTERSEGTNERQMPVYRSMDRQARRIRQCWRIPERDAAPQSVCRLLGFYSPVHGAGQSVSAILMGLNLAETAPSLLLNLERYPGLRRIIPGSGGSLSDLLYYARVQGDPLEHLPELTEYLGPLAFIPPVREADDLLEMNGKDWGFLLEQLRSGGGFRYILIDLGDGIVRPEEILKYCDRVYVPLREDRLAIAKWEEWREHLEAAGGESFLAKLRPYRLPPENMPEWVDHRELRLMSWGRCLKALAEAEL